MAAEAAEAAECVGTVESLFFGKKALIKWNLGAVGVTLMACKANHIHYLPPTIGVLCLNSFLHETQM